VRVARLALVHAGVLRFDLGDGEDVAGRRKRVTVAISRCQPRVVERRGIDEPLVTDVRHAGCITAELSRLASVNERVLNRYREPRRRCRQMFLAQVSQTR